MSMNELAATFLIICGILAAIAIIGYTVHSILTNRTFLAYFNYFWKGDE